MRWTVHGERSLYQSPWVNLALVEVQPPGGERFEHHVVRMPRPAAGTVVMNSEGDLLLLYRHRFIGDFWGWEIPAGRVEAGETAIEGARRECVEEVGWSPRRMTPLTTYHWAGGLSDGHFLLFLGENPLHVGPPTDLTEAERIAWFAPHEVRELIRNGDVNDGLSLTALLWTLTFVAKL